MQHCYLKLHLLLVITNSTTKNFHSININYNKHRDTYFSVQHRMSFGDFMFLFLQCYRQDYITAPKNQWTNHDLGYDFEFPSHAKKLNLAHRKPKFGVVHFQYRTTICKIRPSVLLVNLPPHITASLLETQSALIAGEISSAILNHGVWSSTMYSKSLLMASNFMGNSSVCLIARSGSQKRSTLHLTGKSASRTNSLGRHNNAARAFIGHTRDHWQFLHNVTKGLL